MSAAQTLTTQQSFDLSYWAYSQAGTPYVDGPTQLPDGFSYLMSGGAPVIDYDPSTGFYGAALVSSDGQVVIAFEGTNLYTGNDVFTAAQAIDDAYITYGMVAPSFVSAYAFTETAIEDAAAAGYTAPGRISLTGHSLGGADAEYVAQQISLPGVTFGAPGIATPEGAASPANFPGFIPNEYDFLDYVDEGDPVGNYASDGNDALLLQAQTIAHYGYPISIGSYLNAALLSAATVAYLTAESSPSPSVAAADYAASAASLALAASEYHPLEHYAADLGLTVPGASGGPSATATGASSEALSAAAGAGEVGGVDIPGLDITAPGALQITGDTLTITSDGQSDSLPLPASPHGLSVSSDGQGGTLIAPGAASSGYVFAGAAGATIQGGSGALFFVGGSGAVSVTGGSGNTSLFGSTGSTSVLRGGSGSNVISGGAGSNTLVGGTGASTLIGGSGSTREFANGAAPVELIGGAGANTIYGATSSGTEAVFTGSGVTFAGLNGAGDTVVGGSGVSSVAGGSGQDIFGFIDGHAGGSMVIAGLTARDSIVFGGYAADPITSEGVVAGSDLITLSDGTIILLQSIDHKVFNGLV